MKKNKKVIAFFLREGKLVLLGYALLLACIVLLALFILLYPDTPIMAIIAGALMSIGLGLLFNADFGIHAYAACKERLQQKEENKIYTSTVRTTGWPHYSLDTRSLKN